MLSEHEVNEAIGRIAAMGRDALVSALRSYRADFPLEMTDAFLGEQDEARLKHLLAALCLHCGRMPDQRPNPPRRRAA